MALLKNYQALNDTPGRWFSGGATGQGMTRAAWNRPGPARGRFYGEAGYSALSSWPAGYTPTSGSAFVVAQKSGGMAASFRIRGGGAFAGAGALGMNVAAPLAGSGDITNAQGALIMFAVAELVGDGDLAGAIAALGNVAAGLTGAGDLDGTGQLLTILEAVAALSGAGDLSGDLGARAGASALLAGVGALAADASALGSMAAGIVVTGDALSTANVGEAVWSATLAQFLSAGSTGEALNAAGGAGDPWITAIPGAYGAGSAGKLLGDLLEAGSVDGLDVLEALRVGLAVLAGKSSGFASGAGTRTIRAIDDSKDRLVAVQDANANRTSTTLDGA